MRLMQIVVAAFIGYTHLALAGFAHVFSSCGQVIYYASVPANGDAQMIELPSEGYSEAYGENDIGVSIKLSLSPGGDPLQFEFTPSGDSIYYDISVINGDPFTDGWSLQPSSGSSPEYPTCVSINCANGAGVCSEAYNQPDEIDTKVCSISTDLTLNLCPGGPSEYPSELSSITVPLVSSPNEVLPPSTSQTTFSKEPTSIPTVYSTGVDVYPSHSSHFDITHTWIHTYLAPTRVSPVPIGSFQNTHSLAYKSYNIRV